MNSFVWTARCNDHIIALSSRREVMKRIACTKFMACISRLFAFDHGGVCSAPATGLVHQCGYVLQSLTSSHATPAQTGSFKAVPSRIEWAFCITQMNAGLNSSSFISRLHVWKCRAKYRRLLLSCFCEDSQHGRRWALPLMSASAHAHGDNCGSVDARSTDN